MQEQIKREQPDLIPGTYRTANVYMPVALWRVANSLLMNDDRPTKELPTLADVYIHLCREGMKIQMSKRGPKMREFSEVGRQGENKIVRIKYDKKLSDDLMAMKEVVETDKRFTIQGAVKSTHSKPFYSKISLTSVFINMVQHAVNQRQAKPQTE